MPGNPFRRPFVHPSLVALLKQRCKSRAAASPDVLATAGHLAETGLLAPDNVFERLQELSK
jgi:hypothetical protein